MHDIDDNDKPRTLGKQLDPLRGAPPVGVWVLWHGQKAAAVLRLAEEKGRPVTAAERAAVQLPANISTPREEGAPAWVLAVEGRRWMVRRDDGGEGYVSAYVVGLEAESAAPGP